MSELWLRNDGEQATERVQKGHPLPVNVEDSLDDYNFTGARVAVNTLVKTGHGFLHTVTLSQADAAPTAGSVTIYDNVAGSGTIIFRNTFTTAVFSPLTLHLDQKFAVGLYVAFDTTADVDVVLSYREL